MKKKRGKQTEKAYSKMARPISFSLLPLHLTLASRSRISYNTNLLINKKVG